MNRIPAARAAMIGGALSLLAACAPAKPCRSFPRCDIRDPACQADIWREAQCTRNAPASAIPPVRVIDVATLRAELEASAADHVPTPDEVHLDRALELMRLVPAGSSLVDSQIEASVASLGAYYDPDDGSITIVDRGAMDGAWDVALLDHEMVHAVQDRAHDLDAFLRAASSTDEEIARRMLVEGEATTHMMDYYSITSGLREREIDWGAFYRSWLEETRAIGPGTIRWSLGTRALAYPLGGRAIMHGWLADRSSPPERFDAPPESAIGFFFDPFALERGRTAPAETLCEAPAPPSGGRVVHDDRLGPALLYAFVAQPGGEDTAFSVARSWEQDRMTVVASADGLHTAVLWRIQLASSMYVSAFLSSASWWRTAALHTYAMQGTEIVLLASDDSALLEAWAGEALAPCR